MKKSYTLVVSLLFFASLVTAQQLSPEQISPCGIHNAEEAFFAEHPEARSENNPAYQELEDWTKTYATTQANNHAATVYVIPIVFHIIHNNGPENITDAQVIDGLRILNEDFRMLNADVSSVVSSFSSLATDVQIEFRLAQKDPNGNCTSGINRVVSVKTYDGDQAMKNLIQWPRNNYLNVWICSDAAGAAGYTMLPSSVSGSWGASADGIVLRSNYVGSIGTSSYYTARTLTHECGHWINLSHTWGGTNTPAVSSNCTDDDGVSDTPNTEGWLSCNLSGTTCSSLDNVQNYMDYSYCSRMFTQGQVTRMRASVTSSIAQRNQLWTNSNLIATGTDGVDILCSAEFSAPYTVICVGDSIPYTDASYHGVTQWNWTFNGGSPGNSTTQNPTVTYNTPGTYDVTLVAGNGSSTVSTTKTGYVLVLPSTGSAAPFSEGFESIASWPSADWFNYNPDNAQGWKLTTAAAASGTSSLELENRLNSGGETDEYISVTYDLSGYSSMVIGFDYAFKQKATINNDKLQLYVSNDCGQVWSLRKVISGPALSTSSGTSSSNWAPNSSEWIHYDVTTIPATYLVNDFRFKFVFVAGGGNNIFMDNINLDVNVGVENHEVPNFGLNIYPNPIQGNSVIEFRTGKTENVSIRIVDILGQEVSELLDEDMSVGKHTVTIPDALLAKGIYFVKLSVDKQIIARKIVVQ